ncbi:MAG: ABC transporter permease [Nocardioides sp.]|jgi:spermidine/putrescine transport system permease protein
MAEMVRRRGRTGYLLLIPGLAWLIIFFLIPFYSLVAASLYGPNGSDVRGYKMTYHWQNYRQALIDYGKPTGYDNVQVWLLAFLLGSVVAALLVVLFGRWGLGPAKHPEITGRVAVSLAASIVVVGLVIAFFLYPLLHGIAGSRGENSLSPLLRSLVYGAIATGLCLLLGFVLAYAIAFKAGRWKNLMLVLVIAPFFTSFLVRTLSWKLLLGDGGWIVGTLKALHILGADGQLLYTPIAVIAGLTYNFLPFMVLPLFASLDKIDYRLIEASRDLYANPIVGFFRVTWPLALPGVISGTLLTFIPAVGDYINAELLGSTKTRMIGSVIQSLFTDANDYPAASALSVMLMVLIVGMVLVYVRRAGTDELL